jgi:hypothetical protein
MAGVGGCESERPVWSSLADGKSTFPLLPPHAASWHAYAPEKVASMTSVSKWPSTWNGYCHTDVPSCAAGR